MNDTAEIRTPVRAIIADDHPLVLLAIENLMRGYPNMQIVGRAADATELFMEVDRSPCDLVLMDLYMPGGSTAAGWRSSGNSSRAIRMSRSSCSPWKPKRPRCSRSFRSVSTGW